MGDQNSNKSSVKTLKKNIYTISELVFVYDHVVIKPS
jgi:hypothetical protein